MTDNEVTREKTFNEELPYFKERMKDAFERYTNSDGHIDVVDISLLIDTKRILRKAEEEINRQQKDNINLKAHLEQLKSRYDNAKAEIERLEKTEIEIDDFLPQIMSYENVKWQCNSIISRFTKLYSRRKIRSNQRVYEEIEVKGRRLRL